MTHEKTPDAELRRRQITLAVAATALVGGLGCATALTASRPNSTRKEIEGPVVLTDTILALGRLDPELAAAVEQPNAVAFLGKAQSYFVARGGEKLLSIAQQLDNDRLALEFDRRPGLHLRDQTLWGSVHLRYATLPADAPAEQVQQELARLRKLGFLPAGQGMYRIAIHVEGVVRPPLKIPASMPTLARTPEIVLRAPSTTERSPNLGKFAMLPIAVAVDVMLAPVYLAGLVVLGIGMLAH